jgi:hypothetical protein
MFPIAEKLLQVIPLYKVNILCKKAIEEGLVPLDRK